MNLAAHEEPLISVIIPAYNESQGIERTVTQVTEILSTCKNPWEIIVVDDGSQDSTYQKICSFSQSEPRIKAIALSRNFGKEGAIFAGLEHASGEAIITIDADLQHPPTLIPEMLDKWRNGAQIVHAVKRIRQEESAGKKATAYCINKMISGLGGINVNNSSDFKLLDREIVDIIVHILPERERFYRGLTSWLGFSEEYLYFDVDVRQGDESKWSFWSLLELTITALTSFTSLPLRIVTFLGIATLTLGFGVAIDAVWSLIRGEAVSGFATTIISLLLIGSSLADFMNRRLQSVNINDTQNNPYQPDITYRGFNASPVLGTPIGISVYQDGVRVNEAFGDTVNWDLIPQIAIANMEMQPGSNPLYGLNTLGGALSIRTKSGFSHPGLSAQAMGGSFGRQSYQAEYGGSHDKFDWYFAGNIFDDGGWRPFSPTSVNQGFGKVGWEDDKTDLDLSFTYAGNTMQGVGPTPQELLQQSWTAINTAPDITRNTMYFVNLKGSHRFTDYLQLSGNAYNRNNDNYILNSNTSNCQTDSITLTSCLDANSGLAINPAFFQTSRARQNGTGVNLQLTSDYKINQHENQLVVGGGYNYSSTHFKSDAQAAIFTPDRFEIATGPSGDTNFGPTVNITGHNRYSNLFATDNFSVFDWMHVNASVNWLQAQVFTVDHFNQNAVDPNTGVNPWLGNAVHFQRANPSAGITFNPFDALSIDTPLKEFTTYFNYNEGFRAPTTVEMACANPDAPCSLPNGFVSDPTLKPVVSHTLEAGFRGKFSQNLKWNFALYQTINSNDILFLNAPNGSPNLGYFSNVGTTKRQGLELGLNGMAFEKLNWYISYGYVDATYQSSMTLQNALGPEMVTAGNKIPSIPQNTFKVGSEYELFNNFFIGGDLQHASSQYARGDDQNINPQIPDYTIVNLNSRYKLTKNVELFAMGRNIFDNRYRSFGQLGTNFFTGQATQFQGPGAPAAGYAGVRVNW